MDLTAHDLGIYPIYIWKKIIIKTEMHFSFATQL